MGNMEDREKEALLRLGRQRLEKRRKAKDYLKRMSLARTKAEGIPEEKRPEADLCVLLLMDDEQNRGMLNRLLTERGFRVLEADDLRPALNLMSQQIPEVLILEKMQGAVAGLQTLQTLRTLEKLKDLPVLMILSAQEAEREHLYAQVPHLRTLHRPFMTHQVLDSMHGLLEKSLPDEPLPSDDSEATPEQGE